MSTSKAKLEQISSDIEKRIASINTQMDQLFLMETILVSYGLTIPKQEPTRKR